MQHFPALKLKEELYFLETNMQTEASAEQQRLTQWNVAETFLSGWNKMKILD